MNKLFFILLCSSAIIPTNSFSMEWFLNSFGRSTKEIPVSRQKDAVPLEPVAAAEWIQERLAQTTALPDPVLDIVHDYSAYHVTTINLFDKQFAEHASVTPVNAHPPIHSLVNVGIDSENCLTLLLANGTRLHVNLPQGTLCGMQRHAVSCALLTPRPPRAITYRHGQVLVNRTVCSYLIDQALINETASNDLYHASIAAPERAQPTEHYDKQGNSFGIRQEWYARDSRYNEEDWLLGRDRRRTTVEISLKVKEILARKRLEKKQKPNP